MEQEKRIRLIYSKPLCITEVKMRIIMAAMYQQWGGADSFGAPPTTHALNRATLDSQF